MTSIGRRHAIAGLIGAASLPGPARSQSTTPGPKRGGTLRMSVNTVPASGSIHEELSLATVQPFMPVFNNLVIFDQRSRLNAPDTIVPDLAIEWAWSEGNTLLTFKLQPGVTWHDGRPLSSADVKATWDAVLGKRQAGWRRTPRAGQFANLVEVATRGDDAVTFKLARPQPSFMTLLATGFSPIYPAHVSAVTMRRRPVGTGPFKVADFNNDGVRLIRNDAYWKPGRPYLDAIETTVIPSAATLSLAFAAARLDIASVTLSAMAELKAQVPAASYVVDMTNTHFQLFINRKRPPFDDVRVRQAANLTLDRQAFIKTINAGYGAAGGVMLPPPNGIWGLPQGALAQLPGYGPDIEASRTAARALMREAGYGPQNPLKVQLFTRNVATFQSPAILLMDQLRQVWIEAELKIIETAQWESFQPAAKWSLLMSSYGAAADEPDVVLFDGFACGSASNYGDYCSPDIQAQIEAQSATIDPVIRKAMVQEIDRLLQDDVARPVLLHNVGCTCQQPYVKDFVTAENAQYNHWRMEDVWLDR